MEILEANGLHPRIVAVLRLWLDKRFACVIVGGEKSDDFEIINQVFQGTVLGPILWDVFLADVNIPIRKAKFKEVAFADDLNAYREYEGSVNNKLLKIHAMKCQEEVHSWGKSRRVTFEPSKESISVISKFEPEGPDFKVMGLWFDTGLSMKRAISDLCTALRWKLTSLFRANRFFDTPSMVIQFKARILSYVEHRTSAIYHADSTALDTIDHQYDRFLAGVGLTRKPLC